MRDSFQIADLVICKYDFEYMPFHNWSREDDKKYFGIVVRINGKTRAFYGDDYVHQVFCMDGRTRYFVGSEMRLVYR